MTCVECDDLPAKIDYNCIKIINHVKFDLGQNKQLKKF